MMKTSTHQARDFWSISRKALGLIALASAITGLTASPALADRDDNHGQGNRQGNRHGNQGQRGWHGDRDGNRHGYGYRPMYQQPYSYAQPVYVPPPVYYEPRQSPGVSLFFPLDLRR